MYWLKIALWSVTPTLIVHLIFGILWMSNPMGSGVIVSCTILELATTMLFLPIYLVIANYRLAKKHKKKRKSFFVNTVIILICILFSQYLHLLNWSLKTGSSLRSDREAVGVMTLGILIGTIVDLIGVVIAIYNLKSPPEF
jgi:hypothetical protein